MPSDPTVPDLERDDDENSSTVTRLNHVASLIRRGSARMDRISSKWSPSPPPEPDKPGIRAALADVVTAANEAIATAQQLTTRAGG